jgi:hypothetical protein
MLGVKDNATLRPVERTQHSCSLGLYAGYRYFHTGIKIRVKQFDEDSLYSNNKKRT